MTDNCTCRVDFTIGDEPEVLLAIEDDGGLELVTGEAVIISDVFPEYDGPYLVTPTRETQILETRNRVLLDRVTVGPIPQNYGLITYNGATITVS